ncbi:GNAT family N-acetyltransferase [Bacillus sp. ISL-47]|uniref:GNAT family N-acetyltransferase n=1 Tax=Bacillus sp. ISL-47 TaxID=2819130 RepID=UPI001BEBF66B|nr:GNAT family N-acetyltransferase [Bacillus sp. ISL-47]MBT2688240.1 GNAT family N-acetyltransferase [Bacillus sp. ISL-47]MBT2710033.1 GNAT family N-acetyltransferase [Pseudomonas sp. ISL-84]
MNLQLKPVTEKNFFDIINLKSEEEQEKKFQIFERMVGSNAFFIALASVNGWTCKAIYDGDMVIGFATHGLDKEQNRYELVSLMLGHQFQGKGYGTPSINLVIKEMKEMYVCDEIYLSVIKENEPAIRVYEKAGFEPTGEIFQAFHPEPVYRLKV